MTKVQPKIGFHTGAGGGNLTGITSDYIIPVLAAGKNITIVAADTAAGLYDACVAAKNYQNTGSVLCYRTTDKRSEGGFDFDALANNFAISPEDNAVLHWAAFEPTIPAELRPYKDVLELIILNEIRGKQTDEPIYQGLHIGEYLGRFALAYRTLTDWRLLFFGFASGEPEPDLWEQPSMLDFLRLCGQRPHDTGVALHEYSYNVNDILDGYPYKVGRFMFLFHALEKRGIPWPRVVISEWGWTLDNVPEPAKALADIDLVFRNEYAPFAQIAGAAVWWLGPGFGGIADKAQRLIKPVGDYIVSTLYDVEIMQPQPPDGGEGEPMKHKAIVVKLPQDMTATEWNAAAAKAFEFRHTMTASHDDMMTVLNGGNEESYVKFSHPERDGAAVGLVEAAGYTWQRLYGDPPAPQLLVIDIVDDLPKHATLKYPLRLPTDITTLTIHHTVSPPDRSIESLATYHVNSNGWPGIGYHYVIKDDGRTFLTNYLTTKSYHAGSTAAPGDENAISVGIALQGDFTNTPPPQAQLDAARALVAHLLATLPKVTAVLGHRQMPGAATACPGATWAQWLPYVAGGEIVNPPAPPPAQTYDLLPYMRGTHKQQHTLQYTWVGGGTQTVQNVHDGNEWKIVKGGSGEYEQIYHDDAWIYRAEDTSESQERFYTHSTNGTLGAAWVKRHMAVGEVCFTSKQVQHYLKAGCVPQNGGLVTDKLTLTAVYPTYTFASGLTLPDVIRLEWAAGEGYLFAKGYGLVGFEYSGGKSYISELALSGRADLPIKVPGCIDLSGRYYV